MTRHRHKPTAIQVPEAERAFLAGLLELLTDDPPRCREAVALVEPAALTIEAGPELLVAVTEAAALEAPALADVLRIARERATDPAADGVEPERVLLVNLVEASAGNRGGYARGVDRHAREITKAATRRRTIEAARAAEAVAADPGSAAEEIEAAARGVAAASATVSTERLEWEPFPVELLPDPVGTFVAETAAGLGADAAFVALPLMAGVAAVIGNRRRIELWNGWQEPAILWAATVAESGSMKTPAMDKSLRFLRERQRAAFVEYRAALADWEAEKRELDTARRSRSTDGASISDKPMAERFIIDDLTVEALTPILDASPRGVLLDRDELSGWFDFDRYSSGKGGAEVARWLSIYNGGAITCDRKLSGTVFVPAALVSIAGGIQPKVLARVVGSRHVDNGLLQRFVLAAPPRRQKVLPGDGPGFATVATMETMFSTLAALPAGPDGGPIVLDLDPAALEVFRGYWQELAAEQFYARGAVAAMLSKSEAWAGRLALVCHLIRQAGAEPTLGHRIDVDSIRRGVGLARWAAREWRRVFHGIEHGAALEDDTALRQWIVGRGGVATARDVARGLTKYRSPGAAEAALQRLTRVGTAEWHQRSTGGRPADAVRLRP